MSKLKKYIFKSLLLSGLIFGLTGCCSDEEGKIPITTTSCEAKENYLSGRELLDNLQRQKALIFFEKAIELDPDFALAYYGAAMAKPKPEETFKYLDKAVALSETASEGEQLLIKAMQSGVNRENDKQLEFYEILIKKYPNDERALFEIGNYYFSQRDYKKAIDYYKQIIQMNETFAPVYNQLGYAFRFLEKYDAAEKTFKKYIRLIPNNPNPYDSYAELLLKMGEYEASLEQYSKAIKYDSTFVASYIGMATNLVYISDYYEARLLMEQFYYTARNEEEKSRARVFTAITYVDEENYDKAIEILNLLIIESEKSNSNTSQAIAYGMKSAIFFESKKYDEAINAYKNAIKIIKDSNIPDEIKKYTNFDILFGEGLVLSKKQKYKSALNNADQYMEEAKRKNDMNQIRKGNEMYGRIFLDMKDYVKAIDYILKSDLHNPYNLYLLAIAYEKNNDIDNAKINLKKVVNFNSILDMNYAFCRLKAKYKLVDLH